MVNGLVAAAVVALAMSMAAGCSGGTTGAEPATTAAPGPTVATPATAGVTTTTSRFTWTPEQQPIVDAYVAFHWAFVKADRQAVPDFTELARYSAGEVYQNNVIMLKDSHEVHGEQGRPGPQNLAQVVVYRQGDRDGHSYVDVCVVDDTVIFRRSDNAVVNDKVTTQRVGAQIDKVDGHLKVTGHQAVQEWPGAELEQCLSD